MTPVQETSELHGPRGRWIRLRMGFLCGLLALGLGLVVAGGYDLMIARGATWRELAEQQRQRRLSARPKRGTLYDRNGTALAVSVEVPSVTLDAVELLRDIPPQRIPFVARDAANRLASVLSLDAAAVERKILQKRRFSWLKRRVSADEVERLRRLVTGNPGDGDRIRGVSVQGEDHRYYPRRELAGPVLGFVAPDGEGKDGLELALNSDLKGHSEQLAGLRDRYGRLLFADAVADDAALAGHNVTLSIDQGIQYSAESALAAAARTFEADGGSVVAVDPRTGEILAIASWPGYNPNDYTKSEVTERRDRAVADAFEPGSSMKIFTISAGLSTSAITATERIYCEKGIMKVDNVFIRDTHPAEWLSVPKVMALSSNICAAKIGMAVGSERLYETLRRFGFGETTGLPVIGESSGTLRPKGRDWVDVETAAASFGQGISVTALQLAMATSAIANGGELMEPILIKKVETSTGEVIRLATPTVRRRVIPRRVALQVTEMMIGVTEGEGTGTEAAISGYQVAGKTATAQKVEPKTGHYSSDKFVASFVGFVPAHDPVIAMAVVLDDPMVNHAGGNVAAPVFRRVAQMALEYKGLTPRGTDQVDLASLSGRPDPANRAYEMLRIAQGDDPAVQETEKSGPVAAGSVRVPDMTGWPMRETLRRAVELGLVPEIHGSGRLLRQSPGPGEAAPLGNPLKLFFEPAS